MRLRKLLVVVFILALMPSSVLADAPGAISGRVTNEAGKPLKVCVTLVDPAGNPIETRTKAGRYSVTVPAGTYKVYFEDCDASAYFPEWYSDKDSFETADEISVVPGVETTGIDGVLTRAGRLLGRVTDISGNPIPFANVNAEGPVSVGVNAGADGTYAIPFLTTGSYRVQFACSVCVTEWYNDKRDPRLADTVRVVLGHDTIDIDAAMTLAGRITGVVSDAAGRAAEGECVTARSGDDSWIVFTVEDGSYEIWMPPGSYRVSFGGCIWGTDYPPNWYPDTADPSAAVAIEVVAAKTTTGINGIVRARDGISGIVRDTVGNRLSGACVTVTFGDTSRTTTTNPYGRYVFAGLPEGRYTVIFDGCDAGMFARTWYDASGDPSSAAHVGVANGSEAAAVDAVLPAGGAIEGTVRAADGPALAGICVDVYDVGGNIIADAQTNYFNGRYRTPSIRPGAYRLHFIKCQDDGSVFEVWYEDATDFDAATPVSVDAGAVTVGIDVSMKRCVLGRDGDGDGLNDCDELRRGTDPEDSDSDGDLFSDGLEVNGGYCAGVPIEGGSDPMNPLSVPPGVDLPLPNPGPFENPAPAVC